MGHAKFDPSANISPIVCNILVLERFLSHFLC